MKSFCLYNPLENDQPPKNFFLINKNKLFNFLEIICVKIVQKLCPQMNLENIVRRKNNKGSNQDSKANFSL